VNPADVVKLCEICDCSKEALKSVQQDLHGSRNVNEGIRYVYLSPTGVHGGTWGTGVRGVQGYRGTWRIWEYMGVHGVQGYMAYIWIHRGTWGTWGYVGFMGVCGYMGIRGGACPFIRMYRVP